MTDTALKIESLTKSFRVVRSRSGSTDPRRERYSWRKDRFWALRGVGFSVARGETVGLIGPNGSGKSTLLKILSGVMTPESGRFEAQGRIGALLELGAGFHPDLSGIENVYLNGALLGMSSRDVDRLLPEIIAFAELERFMDMPVRHYSSGMTARLGFAVATQLAPDILLMDETFATGDARFQTKALEHVALMKSRGHTLILVSHNAEMILLLADRVIWMDQGKIQRDGPTRDILNEYRRSQQMSIYATERVRATLGMESLFDAVDPALQTVRIESARLSVRQENGGADSPDTATAEGPLEENDLEIRTGVTLQLDLELTHPGEHPPQIHVETAWVRDGDRIIAQSRTKVRLRADRDRTRVRLKLGPWELTEATWRMAIALSPVLTSAEAERNFRPRYFDRKLDAGTVRVVTPNPFELPVITPIHTTWSF